MMQLHRAIRRGLVVSCHDCSDGGLFVTLAEMVIGGGWGVEVALDTTGREPCGPAALLFSESQGRFVVEVDESRRSAFDRLMEGTETTLIGRVIPEPVVSVTHRGSTVLEIARADLDAAWREALEW